MVYWTETLSKDVYIKKFYFHNSTPKNSFWPISFSETLILSYFCLI